MIGPRYDNVLLTANLFDKSYAKGNPLHKTSAIIVWNTSLSSICVHSKYSAICGSILKVTQG